MALPWFLLKEDGDKILLETGDKIILDLLYMISGVVTLGGSPVTGAIVTLIDSDADLVVGTDTTDANGYYEFSGLDVATIYHATVEYDDGSDLWNAKSLPFLTPVR